MKRVPDDFEDLKKLLALKRHERPPPGYFDTFSAKVMARIAAAQVAQQNTWWRRLLFEFDAKPVLVGAYAAAAGGLVLFALSFSPGEAPPTLALPVNNGPALAVQPTGLLNPVGQPMLQPLAASTEADISSSVDPVVSDEAPGFLFDINRLNLRPQQPQPQPVNFNLDGKK